LVEDILSRLEINRAKADLFVSATSPDSADFLGRRLKSYRKGKVEVRLVENRGRDVAPMLVEFASALAEYDLIGHVHGKNSAHLARQSKAGSDFVRTWRSFLLENLLGDRVPALDILVAEFDRHPDLGLVFPEDPHICGWGDNFPMADRLRRRLELAELPQAIEFPVGNMFIARSRALAPLFGAGLSLDDFPEEPVMSDGTMMHAIERLTPLVCEKAGFRWLTTRVQGISR
jgi:lipopolysaccharide biosynthesis protein